LRDVNDASGLHFNNPVCNELDELRHQFLHSSFQFQKFDPDRKMLATYPRCALCMKAMMSPKT
jgi:hypothetical protein